MKLTEHDYEILAKTVYGEARGEGREGQKAIVCCVINRVVSKRWFAGRNVAETCQKPYQFSCWNKSDPNAQILVRLSETIYSKYYPIINDVLVHGDITHGATHYYNPKVVHCPEWAKGKKPCAEIGHHLFFKDIN